MAENKETDAFPANERGSSDFIRKIIDGDIKDNKHGGMVKTRFPPEPNGYPHIGHAKAICLNFGIAEDYKGDCNLRFDDTDPSKESMEYVEAIKRDIRWLGFDWENRLFFASDYFGKLYDCAIKLIKKGKAYVDSQSVEEIRKNRGVPGEPGKNSPFRNRTLEENLSLFERMKKGEFKDGEHVLRAKIDMASQVLIMRDPILYRIKHVSHYRTGDQWCIYPMYDYTHCLSDAFEGVTHSLCSLEFSNNRVIYDWLIDEVEPGSRPEQIEFSRLNLTYTMMSKRKLLTLVNEGHMTWDDPRMLTLSGLRRRGYTPKAIRNFCMRIGIANRENRVDMALLEYCIREELNKICPRVMAVLHPLKLVIDNYPDGKTEEMEAINNPEDEGMGSRKVPFSKILYIEKDDFREEAPKKWFRLAPGKEVRLRYGYYVTVTDFKKDPDTGEVVELHCAYDPETRGGDSPDGRKVKGTIHWVSAEHCYRSEVRLYDRLFSVENPDALESEGKDYHDYLNPNSMEILEGCCLEPSLKKAGPGERFQFERLGYFFTDPEESKEGKPVFNRTIPLRDSWAKLEKSAQ